MLPLVEGTQHDNITAAEQKASKYVTPTEGFSGGRPE